jgi:hypothetical protein
MLVSNAALLNRFIIGTKYYRFYYYYYIIIIIIIIIIVIINIWSLYYICFVLPLYNFVKLCYSVGKLASVTLFRRQANLHMVEQQMHV